MRAHLETLAAAAPVLVAVLLFLLAIAYVPVGQESLVPSGLMQPKALIVIVFVPSLIAACVAGMLTRGTGVARLWVLLLGTVTVMYAVSYLRWYSTADYEVPLNVILFAATFLALSATPQATGGVLAGLLAAGLACAALITLQSFGIQPPGWRPSPAIAGPAGTFLHRNMSAYMIAAAVPIGAHVALRARTPALAALMVPTMALLGAGLILSRSRGVWLACIIACGCMAVVGWRRPAARRIAVAGVMVVAVVLGAYLSARTAPPLKYGGQIVVEEADLATLDEPERANVEHERVLTRLDVTRSNDSFNKRQVIWKQALHGSVERPLLGHGPGSFPAFAAQRGMLDANQWPYQHAHNDYLQAVIESGWAAGACLFAFVALVLLGGLRSARREPQRWPPVLLAVAVVFAFRAMVEVQVTSPAMNLYAAAAFGALVAGVGRRRLPVAASSLAVAALLTVVAVALIALGPYRGLGG